MEKIRHSIFSKNCIVKKIIAAGASLFLVIVSANAQTEKKDPPPPPPPNVDLTKFTPPIIIAKGEKADDFYNRNPSVKEISRQGNKIILKLKDGTKQEYNVNNKDEIKGFTDEYGESPLPPPPTAPPKKV